MKSKQLHVVVLLCAGLVLFLTFPAAHSSRIDPVDEFNGYELAGLANDRSGATCFMG